MINSALDGALGQFKSTLSGVGNNIRKTADRISSPISNFVKQATNIISVNPSQQNKQTSFSSMNYRVNDLQNKPSPIISNFIKSAQKGIQDWGQKNPAQAQKIIDFPSKAVQAVTEPIAAIPFKISKFNIENSKKRMIPITMQQAEKAGQKDQEIFDKLFPRNIPDAFIDEMLLPQRIAASTEMLPEQTKYVIPYPSDPKLEQIKQRILNNPNIRPLAKEYLSNIPITYEESMGRFSGMSMGEETPGRQILINKDILKPRMVKKAGDTIQRQETSRETAERVDIELNDTIKHELLHQTPELVPNKLFKPINKKVIDNYINRWSKEYFQNPENKEFDTKRLVGEMFAEEALPPIYYFHIFKQIVPDAKPSNFIQAIKSYFVNNINNPDSNPTPNNDGIGRPVNIKGIQIKN